MPEISRFYGIVVRMYFDEHPPPHFHAYYAGQEALIDFRGMSLYAGRLSPRALGLVMEWTALHQAELQEVWNAARRQETLWKIDPLP
jgi:hypothetical protein